LKVVKRALTWLTVPAGAAVLAAAAVGAEAPTLTVDKPIVTLATSTEVSTVLLAGSVPGARANEDFWIEHKECGRSSYVRARPGHTDASGRFHEPFSPLMLTSYRVRWQETVSNAVTVRARPAIRFGHLGGNRFDVWILAMRFFDGKKGRLERFDAARSRWVLVKRATLRRQSGPTMARSGARFTAPVRRGWLVRFVLPRDQVGACYLAGISLLVRVR
jgi:hypothetical protein